LAIAEQLLQDASIRAEAMLLKGLAAAGRGDWVEARAALERAAVESPQDPDTLDALCRFLFERDDLAAAEGPLLALIRCDPRNGAAYHNLGMVYLRTGRAPQAVVAFRESLRHRPEAPATRVQLGHALKASGFADEAARVWREALRQNPGDLAAAEALRQVPRRPEQ